jgi:hypothetical protein
MTKTQISGIAPFFIEKNVPAAVRFYRDHPGFDIRFQGPSDDDIFKERTFQKPEPSNPI